jgi:hypothetical protein
MSKTSSLALPEPCRLHGGIAPLAVLIATNLSNAHSPDQYLAGLAALTLALAHDTLIHWRRPTPDSIRQFAGQDSA